MVLLLETWKRTRGAGQGSTGLVISVRDFPCKTTGYFFMRETLISTQVGHMVGVQTYVYRRSNSYYYLNKYPPRIHKNNRNFGCERL